MKKQLIGTHNRYEVWLEQADGSLPDLAFAPYIYNCQEHLRTQRLAHPLSVWVWDTLRQQTLAIFRADCVGHQVISLPNAPFGGLQFEAGTPPEALMALLAGLELWCRKLHYTHLIVKAPPACYGEEAFRIAREVYRQQGFEVLQAHANHHIEVSPKPFMEIIARSERRRLRKCLRAGFSCGEWAAASPQAAYAFLSESRKQLGYPLSLTPEEFVQLLAELPGAARVFAVWEQTELVSLTVALRVSSDIVYNFSPADHLAYRRFSPTVMLNAALYEYARQQGIRRIDLGSSLDHHGYEKASLVRFKENLGGRCSLRETYVKNLATGNFL